MVPPARTAVSLFESRRQAAETTRRYPIRMAKFLLGVLFTLVAIAAGSYLYLKMGHPPVATADPAFPMEAQIVHVPLNARIDREKKTAPFAATQQTFEEGAHLYMRECASCHGVPGKDVAFAKYMFPSTPQLWKKHKNGVVGVSDDEAGETYWKISNGIRLTGMPSYQKILSETEMWQIALLLKKRGPKSLTGSTGYPGEVRLRARTNLIQRGLNIYRASQLPPAPDPPVARKHRERC